MKEDSKIIKKGLIVSIVVCIGKVIGFLKQAVIAWAFGAGIETDIYFAADSYIAMIGQVQSASISPSILTNYIKLKENGKLKEAKEILRDAYIFFPIVAVVLIILNVVFSGPISEILGKAFNAAQRNEVQWFLISLSPVILLTSCAGVAQGILEGNERFTPTKWLSLIFSVSIIVCTVLFHKKIGIKSMLIGFILGYVLHTVYVVWCSREYVDMSIANPLKNRYFMLTIKNMIPLVLGNTIVDLGNLLGKVIASSLDEGSISVLYYGQVISNDLVNAVIITTIGTVLLPTLTKEISNQTHEGEISNRIKDILIFALTLIGLVVTLYIVEGLDLIRIFFERGNFGEDSSIRVAKISVCYAMGFCFMACREILVKAHYAYQDTISPMRNGIFGVIINASLSLFLAKRYGVYGIAIASSISMAIMMILLMNTLKKHVKSFNADRKFCLDILKIVISMIISILIGYSFNKMLSNVFIRLMGVSALIVLVYLGVLLIIGQTKMKAIFSSIKTIIRR